MSIHYKGKDARLRPGWDVIIQFKMGGRSIRRGFVIRGTKSEARSFEARMRAELEAPNAQTSFGGSAAPAERAAEPPNPVPNFERFCLDEYKANAQLHLKASTWTKRSSHVATLIEFFGHIPIDQISNACIDDYKRKRRDDGLRHVSINNELRILRKILLFARDERGISFVPPRIKFLPEAERRPKVWSDVEVQKLFDACSEVAPSLLPMLVCLANTGMRKGEALALKWERVDLERRIIMIWPSDADEVDDDEVWEPKNRRPREVPLSDALLPWLNGDRTSPVWVFPAPRTGKGYAVWPENQFQRVQRSAGLKGGVHTLRHTYASYFLQTKSLAALAGVLGHSHTRVTELYAHLLPNHLEAARNAVSFAPTVGPAIVAAKQRWRKADVVAGEGDRRSRKRARRNVL